MKNGTTVLHNQDAENSEKCRESQFGVLNEDFEHQGQDSPFRMSMESFRENFEGRQTLQKGTTVLQNQDPKQNKECCEAQLCVSDRYPSLIEVENKRTGHFHADNRFDFENTAQAYPKTIEKNLTTYNRARAPQTY